MRDAWKLAAAAAVLLSTSTSAWGVVCTPGTLTDYIGYGAGGCTLGDTTFSRFTPLASAPASTPLDPSSVSVAPFFGGGITGLALVLASNASAGDALEVFFSFEAASGATDRFVHGKVEMVGASATGDGAVTVVDDLCLGGSFSAAPLGCAGTAETVIAFAIEGDSGLLAGLDVAPSRAFIARAVDIVVDGGLTGTAGLESVRISFTTERQSTTVPEPTALALMGIGLAGLGRAVARARRA